MTTNRDDDERGNVVDVVGDTNADDIDDEWAMVEETDGTEVVLVVGDGSDDNN